MKFGIIGAGRIGKIHGGNVAARRDCQVLTVADADPGAAVALAQATGAKAGSIETRRRRTGTPRTASTAR